MHKHTLIPIALVCGILTLSWNAFITMRLSSALSDRSLKEEVILSTVAHQTDAHQTDQYGRTYSQQPRFGGEEPTNSHTAIAMHRLDDDNNNNNVNRHFPRTINMFDARTISDFSANREEKPRQEKRRIYVSSETLRTWKRIDDDRKYPIPQELSQESPEECVSPSWHNSSFPNCNSIHELDISTKMRSHEFHYLASGGFNNVYRVHSNHSHIDVVLKLLSCSRKNRGNNVPYSTMYSHKYYDVVRRDALIAERLTKSPHVLPIYGYCGFATVAPYAAEDGTLDSALNEKSSNGWTRWKNMPSSTQLTYVIDAAKGLADIHDIGVVHGDMSTKQYIFWDGKLQLGDFNQCIFLRRNDTAPDKACTFKSIVNDGSKRSPEEYRHTDLTSAVDVWSLGSILYHGLTGMKVWNGSGKKMDAIQTAVIEGRLPKIGRDIFGRNLRNSLDPVDNILKKALNMCQVYDPEKRATAREVASFLQQSLQELS